MRHPVRDLSPALGTLSPFQSCSERQICFIEWRRRDEWFLKISVNYLLGAQAVPDRLPCERIRYLSLVGICYCLMDFSQPFKMWFGETEFLEVANSSIFKNCNIL